MQGAGHVRTLLVATTMAGIIAIVPACGSSSPTGPDATGALTPLALTEDWPSATPAEAGLDVTRIMDSRAAGPRRTVRPHRQPAGRP